MNSNVNGAGLNWIHQENLSTRNGNDKYRRHKKVLSIVAIVSAVIVFGLLCAYAGRVSTQVSTKIEEVEAASDSKDCANNLMLKTKEEVSPQWTWTQPPNSNVYNSSIIFVPSKSGYPEISSVRPGDYNTIEPYCDTDTFTGEKWSGAQFALSADGSKVVFVFNGPARMIVKPTYAKSIKDIQTIFIPDQEDIILELAIRPDGKQIAFKTFHKPTQIQTVDLETLTFKHIQLLNVDPFDFFAEMVYSPDSKCIYIASRMLKCPNTLVWGHKCRQISTFNAQTGTFVRDYVHPNYAITSFTVSPDGKKFIIIGIFHTRCNLFSVDAQNGSNEHVILETENSIDRPNVSPDGKSVIFQVSGDHGFREKTEFIGKVYKSHKASIYQFEYLLDGSKEKIAGRKPTWISI